MPLDVHDALWRTPLAWAAILGSAPAVVLLRLRVYAELIYRLKMVNF